MMVNEPEDHLESLPVPKRWSMLCAKIEVFVREVIPRQKSRGPFLDMRSD